ACSFAEAINEERLNSPDRAKRIRRLCCRHVAVRRAETARRAVATATFGVRCHRGFLPGFRERVAGRFGCWQRASRSWSLKLRTNHESRRVDQRLVGMRP